MNRMKKLAGLALVASLTAGAGVAWASQADDPTGAGGAGTSAAPGAGTKALGGGTSELKFIPVTPCRLVDTRSAGGKFSPNQTRSYDVRGSGSTFAAQGGKSGGCGIPASGVFAIELTATAVAATGNGFLRIFPESMPNATFMNTTAAFNVSNSGTVGLCGVAAPFCLVNKDISVKNFTSSTDLVIDVQGYYLQPMAAQVNAAGTLIRGSRVVSAGLAPAATGTGTYRVKFDRDVSNCALSGSSRFFGKTLNVVHFPGEVDTVFIKVVDTANVASTADFFVEVTC